MKRDDPSLDRQNPRSDRYVDSALFKFSIAGLSILVALNLFERRWTGAAIWMAILLLELPIPIGLRGERIVKWILAGTLFLLVIAEILGFLPR